MRLTKEITDISRLSSYRTAWRDLLRETPRASFFQSLEWLEVYWKYYGKNKRLRVLIVEEDGKPSGILPLVVQWERTRLGPLRVLTYPLDNWGSFYGPIGPIPEKTLLAGLEHLRHAPHDWDFLELRGTQPPGNAVSDAFKTAGMKAYASRWGQTAIVDLSHGWDAYRNSRKGAWLRRLHQAETKLRRQAKVEYVRYRPKATTTGDSQPPLDYFEICQTLSEKSWQATADDGTTLCHETVRPFLRDLHERGGEEGTIDVNLLLLDDRPAAFIYGYHYRDSVFGLRRGFDTAISRAGVGNVLLWYTLRDSAKRGDKVYDMGPGSIDSKRHFLTHLTPILRHSYFPHAISRTQFLRFRRWCESLAPKSSSENLQGIP